MNDFVNPWLVAAGSWFCAVIVIALNLLLVIDQLSQGLKAEDKTTRLLTACVGTPLFGLLLLFLVYITFKKERSQGIIYRVESLAVDTDADAASLDSFAS